MTDQQVKSNGYIMASTLISGAINEAFKEGVSIDEVFAALKVQAEVTSIKLAQAIMVQQQREAMAAQQAAATTEGEANADAN